MFQYRVLRDPLLHSSPIMHFPPGNPISVSQVDYSKVDLSTATILNKNKHEEGGDALHLDTPELTNNNNNIKKKKAKKQVMSLQEFHAKALGTEVIIIHFLVSWLKN